MAIGPKDVEDKGKDAKHEDVAPKPRPQPPCEHEVVKNDTLSSIAQQYYGDGTEPYWRKIYDRNKEEIGDDPHQIKPGQKLHIPA